MKVTHRTFISAVAGISFVIAGFSAAPARAGDEDVARALAAILGIAIIGAAINDARKDNDAKPVVRHYPRPRPLPKQVNRRVLPENCFRAYSDTRGGRVAAFSPHCLNQRYAYASNLPRTCLRQAFTPRGWRNVYGAKCLRNKGYRVAGR